MRKKFLILDDDGFIIGSDESDIEYKGIPKNWVEVEPQYNIPTFPINKRTKHIWKYNFINKKWEKTDKLRTSILGESLINDDGIFDIEDLQNFNLVIQEI